jgi:hypothetical protein
MGKGSLAKMALDDTQLQDSHTKSGFSGTVKWDWTCTNTEPARAAIR